MTSYALSRPAKRQKFPHGQNLPRFLPHVASLLLVVRPGAPSSFLFLVAMPGASSTVPLSSSQGQSDGTLFSGHATGTAGGHARSFGGHAPPHDGRFLEKLLNLLPFFLNLLSSDQSRGDKSSHMWWLMWQDANETWNRFVAGVGGIYEIGISSLQVLRYVLRFILSLEVRCSFKRLDPKATS